MAFELRHSTLKAFLVPNHTRVSVKLRGESDLMSDWEYRGFDDEQKFVLITQGKCQRWIPISSISYIEQVND